jgi:ABC-type Fe3+-hydroxamate transport system substrate-binding protein
MGASAFLLLLFGSAAALAVWVDIRLSGREPSSLSRVILHAFGAMLCLEVAKRVVVGVNGANLTLIVLLAVVLPALVYVFLTSLWVLKIVRGAMPR